MLGVASGPRMPAQHSFGNVASANISRSSFNRSHGHKTTLDAGYLVPIYVDEAIPGDTFNMSVTTFARLATPIAPIMDNLYCDIFFFAVPIRLVWDNWERFNGARDNPTDSTDFLIPTMPAPAGGHAVGSLSDYFGIPTGIAGFNHSSLWHRAYNLIWNEWFRDQNLQTSAAVPKTNGPDTHTDFPLLKRGKRHDYFTSCLPWPQKGTAVSLPLGTTAPVVRTSNAPAWRVFAAGTQLAGGADNDTVRTFYSNPNMHIGRSTGTEMFSFDPNGGLVANLADATAATVNQLREAFQMQALFERDARGGTRYTEIIRSHFGVTSPDQRLQRPEFLGGGSTMVNVAPVPQTSNTNVTSPQGNLAAIGTFSHSGPGFMKSFTEHCLLMGLMSIRADLNYQQGLNRMFSRSTRYDFYWPALAHLGEQAVLNQEIYMQGAADDTAVFGYQERYAEYRYKPSQITGKFRSTATGPLHHWHLAQHFTALPVLGPTFIQENPPIARTIAVTTEPHFLCDMAFSLRCARPIPVFSVPGKPGHF